MRKILKEIINKIHKETPDITLYYDDPNKIENPRIVEKDHPFFKLINKGPKSWVPEEPKNVTDKELFEIIK